MSTNDQVPVLRAPFEIAQSAATFPFMIAKIWPSIHSIFRPDAQVGTCIYERRVRDKYEIVVRNYSGTGRFRREFQYLDGADQELKIERYSGWPSKIRLSNNSIEPEYLTWDSDHPHVHTNSWNKGWGEYVPFPKGLTSDGMFFQLEKFATNAMEKMKLGLMPEFSDLNEITGMSFKKLPTSFPSTSYDAPQLS